MKASVIEKINVTNQKYLKGLVGKDIPQKLVDQLNNMDWSCLDLIHGSEQKRGTFGPLGAMELPEIEAKKDEFKAIIKEETRKIKFRDDALVADAKSRFKYITDEINLDCDEFIQAIKDAIEAERKNGSVTPTTTKKSTTKKVESK